MSKPNLRISTATSDARRDRELDRITGTAPAKKVSIPLAKIVPLLVDAVESDRAWLHDFAEDLVTVDSDLYDVLLAYQGMNQKAA